MEMISSMIRILLVDDQSIIRQGIKMRFALEKDLEVVGEAGDGKTAVEMAKTLQPDIVVMDVEMPTMDGVAATELMISADPDLPVVILSLYDDIKTRLRAQAAGASAFIEKHAPVETLIQTIRGLAIKI
jgi:DNA-binding NarL/FixJ family response regulator